MRVHAFFPERTLESDGTVIAMVSRRRVLTPHLARRRVPANKPYFTP